MVGALLGFTSPPMEIFHMRSSLALVLFSLTACAHDAAQGSATQAAVAAASAGARAEVKVAGLGGNGVEGVLTLTEQNDGVQVEGDLRGLPPSSTHGFHVHETGDCSAADGSSAGGHFNPQST